MPDQVDWRAVEREATPGRAVGRLLRDQRTARGLDLSDVEKSLHIRRGHLEAIEEEIFYPALKEHPKTKDLALEGYEEHHVVDMVMSEIEGVEPGDETWMAKFTVMKENLEHHIEEEEGEMFPQAEQVFTDGELGGLGDRMQARKEELQAQV